MKDWLRNSFRPNKGGAKYLRTCVRLYITYYQYQNVLKKFEDYYNADNTDLAGELYSDDCYVTVNGGVEAGGGFTGKTNKEVAGFLNK